MELTKLFTLSGLTTIVEFFLFRSCALLASVLLDIVAQDEQLSKRYFAHFSVFAASSAGNKEVSDYCLKVLSTANAF